MFPVLSHREIVDGRVDDAGEVASAADAHKPDDLTTSFGDQDGTVVRNAVDESRSRPGHRTFDCSPIPPRRRRVGKSSGQLDDALAIVLAPVSHHDVVGWRRARHMSSAEAELVAFDVAQHNVPVGGRDFDRELLLPSNTGAKCFKARDFVVEAVEVTCRAPEVEAVLHHLAFRDADELEVRRAAGGSAHRPGALGSNPYIAPPERLAPERGDRGRVGTVHRDADEIHVPIVAQLDQAGGLPPPQRGPPRQRFASPVSLDKPDRRTAAVRPAVSSLRRPAAGAPESAIAWSASNGRCPRTLGQAGPARVARITLPGPGTAPRSEVGAMSAVGGPSVHR